ncbi:unnamed protein product [Closterium sp. Naga37s-1]|nr:unnamed protein product [Closterium sp. Naga37s-1]
MALIRIPQADRFGQSCGFTQQPTMAPTIDQSPFEHMFDLEAVPTSPDSGNMNAADDSYLDLPAAAFPWSTCDEAGKPGGKSGGKSGEVNASNVAQRLERKQLLAALMEALADSADDTAAAEGPSTTESLVGASLSSAALTVGSWKRKAYEIEVVPSAAAPLVGGSEAEVTLRI